MQFFVFGCLCSIKTHGQNISLEQSRPDEMQAEEQEQETGPGKQVLSTTFRLNLKSVSLPNLPKTFFLLLLMLVSSLESYKNFSFSLIR